MTLLLCVLQNLFDRSRFFGEYRQQVACHKSQFSL